MYDKVNNDIYDKIKLLLSWRVLFPVSDASSHRLLFAKISQITLYIILVNIC